MKKVFLGFLSILAALISLVGILLVGISVWGLVNGKFSSESLTEALIFTVVFLLIVILCGWFSIRTFTSLIDIEKLKLKKAEMEEKKKQRDALKESNRMEYLEEARKEKEEQYKKFRQLKEKEAEIIKKEKQEKEDRERDLADDDILTIHRPVRRGIAYYLSLFIYILIPFYIIGTLAIALNNQDKVVTGMRAIPLILGWYIGLMLLFILAVSLSSSYKNGQLQLFIRTRKDRLYFCNVLPRYQRTSQSIFKIKRIIENNAVIEANRNIRKAAIKYINSEEFEGLLADLIRRKDVASEERMNFYYLEDYKIRHGILEDTISYYDFETKKTKKVKVGNIFDRSIF